MGGCLGSGADCGLLLRTSSLSLTPPAGHHAQCASRDTEGKGHQDHKVGRGLPVLAKKEIHTRFVLIVQREGKQGEQDGGFQDPLEQPEQTFHAKPRVQQAF